MESESVMGKTEPGLQEDIQSEEELLASKESRDHLKGNFQVMTLLLVSMDSLEVLINFLEIISNFLETFIRGTSTVTALLLA